MRRAQVGAFPLVLALVEFRGGYVAVFREQPLERSRTARIVSLAVVGSALSAWICSERLGPTRG